MRSRSQFFERVGAFGTESVFWCMRFSATGNEKSILKRFGASGIEHVHILSRVGASGAENVIYIPLHMSVPNVSSSMLSSLAWMSAGTFTSPKKTSPKLSASAVPEAGRFALDG